MSLVASMDGNQCEKDHTLYLEGMAAIFIHVLDYHLLLVCLDFCFLLLFSRVAVLFSIRVFLIGNAYLILKEGEVHWSAFPHFDILAKLPPSATA